MAQDLLIVRQQRKKWDHRTPSTSTFLLLPCRHFIRVARESTLGSCFTGTTTPSSQRFMLCLHLRYFTVSFISLICSLLCLYLRFIRSLIVLCVALPHAHCSMIYLLHLFESLYPLFHYLITPLHCIVRSL